LKTLSEVPWETTVEFVHPEKRKSKGKEKFFCGESCGSSRKTEKGTVGESVTPGKKKGRLRSGLRRLDAGRRHSRKARQSPFVVPRRVVGGEMHTKD